MSVIASQITGISTDFSTVCSGAHQRKHQSFASLAFLGGIDRWPMNSPYKGPVTREMFPFDDVIMNRRLGEIYCCRGRVYIFDYTRSQPLRENVTYVTVSFISEDIASPQREYRPVLCSAYNIPPKSYTRFAFCCVSYERTYIRDYLEGLSQ